MPKKMSKEKQAVIDAAKKMPPLYHKLPNEEFDFRKSRTLWWLIKQPEVLGFLWNLVTSAKAVTYDPQSQKWSGVDFEDNDWS